MEGSLGLQRAATLEMSKRHCRNHIRTAQSKMGNIEDAAQRRAPYAEGKTLLVRSTLLVSVLQPRLLQVPHRAAISLYAVNPLLLQIIRLLLFQPNFFPTS